MNHILYLTAFSHTHFNTAMTISIKGVINQLSRLHVIDTKCNSAKSCQECFKLQELTEI